jgi:hypothetical protein
MALDLGLPAGEFSWGKDVLGYEDVKAAAIYAMGVPP